MAAGTSRIFDDFALRRGLRLTYEQSLVLRACVDARQLGTGARPACEYFVNPSDVHDSTRMVVFGRLDQVKPCALRAAWEVLVIEHLGGVRLRCCDESGS